MTINSVCFITA